MAEIVAAAAVPAAIAALLQLAKYGMDIASAFYSTAKSAGAARRDLKRLAHRIQFFSDTVRVTRDVLKRHCAEYPESRVVLFIKHHDVLGSVKRGSRLLKVHLKDSKDRLEAVYSSSALWMSIKWVFKRSSFLELLPELDGFQAALHLLVAVAHLEASNIKRQSGGIVSEEEIRMWEEERYVCCYGRICGAFTDLIFIISSTLRSSIEALVKTINRLNIRLDQVSQPQERHHEGSGSATPQGQSPRAMLLKLGRSMYRDGVVPELDSSPPTPVSFSRSSGQRMSSRRSSGGARGNRNSRRASSLDQAASADNAPPNDDKSSPPRESCSSQQDPSPTPPTAPHDPTSPPLRTDTPLNDGSAVKILHLNQECNTGTISGYVRSARGILNPARAVIRRGIDGNVISIAEVANLDLDMRPLGGVSNAAVHLVFGPGSNETSVGKVTLQWTRDGQGITNYPPLNVECEVSESCQPGLILGRPFIETRKQYWGE